MCPVPGTSLQNKEQESCVQFQALHYKIRIKNLMCPVHYKIRIKNLMCPVPGTSLQNKEQESNKPNLQLKQSKQTRFKTTAI